jgi:hypothetical protein
MDKQDPPFVPAARGSDTFYTEGLGVTKLDGALLKTRRVRTFFLRNEKTPNLDGYLQLDDPALPFSLLVVQVRTIEAAFPGPDISLDLRFCGACAEAAVPGIYFQVSLADEEVRWLGVNAHFLAKVRERLRRSNQGTITLPPHGAFSLRSDVPLETLKEWRAVADKHAEAMQEVLRALRALDQERLVSSRLQVLVSRPHERSHEFTAAHEMLDELNSVLDGPFLRLKTAVWRDSWKVGIAYEMDEDERLSYGLYAVARDANDLLIKRLSGGSLERLLGYGLREVMYVSPNPLRHPTQFAWRVLRQRQLCEQNLDDLILLESTPSMLAEELTISANHLMETFGLVHRGTLELAELRNSLREYLDQQARMVAAVLPEGFALADGVQLDLSRIAPDGEFERIDSHMEARGLPPFTACKVGSIDLLTFDATLTRALSQGVRTIECPGSPGPGDINETVERMKCGWAAALRAYGDVVKALFPQLGASLRFPRSGTKLLILVHHAGVSELAGTGFSNDSARLWELECKSDSEEPEVDIYGPSDWPTRFALLYEGPQAVPRLMQAEPEIRSVSLSSPREFLLCRTPLLEFVGSTLREALKLYFDCRLEGRAG